MKKRVAILACILFIINCCLFSVGADSTVSVNEYGQVEIFRNILDNFQVKGANMKLQDVSYKEGQAVPEVLYPKEFGGHYYDEQGKLHVNVTVSSKNMLASKDSAATAMAEIIRKNDIDTNLVKYAYSDLLEMQDTINADNSIWNLGVASFVIDVVKNKIIINIKSEFADYQDSIIALLQRLDIDLKAVDFALTDDLPELLESAQSKDSPNGTTSVPAPRASSPVISLPGGEVYYKFGLFYLNKSYGSIGFNAVRNDNGQYGFVTNYHVIQTDRVMYNGGDQEIGKYQKGSRGNNHDEAFVQFGYAVPTQITGICCMSTPSCLDSKYSNAEITAGLSVFRQARTTQVTTGTVLNANFNFSLDGYSYTAIEISNNTQGGDSGSFIGTRFANSDASGVPGYKKVRLMGITFAKINSNSHGLCLKIDGVLNALNVSVVYGGNRTVTNYGSWS